MNTENDHICDRCYKAEETARVSLGEDCANGYFMQLCIKCVNELFDIIEKTGQCNE